MQAIRPRGTLSIPKIGLLDGMSFVIPFVQFVEFQVVGRLFLSEIILLALLPLLLSRRGALLVEKLPRTFIFLGLLWLLAQVDTDLIRSTTFHDFARGWAKIFFTLINFCGLYLLLAKRPKRVILFAVGFALGNILAYFVSPNIYAADYPWKFGYGTGTTWLVVLLAVGVMRRRGDGQMLAALVLSFAAVLNIYLGARGGGGILFLASAYLMTQAYLGRSDSHRLPLRATHVLLIGIVCLLAGWGALSAYEFAAESGMLGSRAKEKYETEVMGEYGLLLGGRSEVLASVQAVIDSPVIGHGSWAKDCKYSSVLVDLKEDLGYAGGSEKEDCLIPTHSYLFGAWVEAGIFGAIFWMWVFLLPIGVLLRLFRTTERLTPFAVVIAFSFMWDILFSPYGAQQRILASYYMVLTIMLTDAYPWAKSLLVEKRRGLASAK